MENKNYLFPDFDKLIFGGDYNPEQWRATPEIWDEDMRLMKLAHWNEATVGVFSWAELEPQEGVYDFSVPDAIFEKAEKNGLKKIHPHSLRHTFATIQIYSGVSIKTVQARTGHAQASTLYNTYLHQIKSADEAATEAIDNILTPKPKDDRKNAV